MYKYTKTDFFRPSSVWPSSTPAWTTTARNPLKYLHDCGYSLQWQFPWQFWCPVYINTGVGKRSGVWNSAIRRTTTLRRVVCDRDDKSFEILRRSSHYISINSCKNYEKYQEWIDLHDDLAERESQTPNGTRNPAVPLVILFGIAKS